MIPTRSLKKTLIMKQWSYIYEIYFLLYFSGLKDVIRKSYKKPAPDVVILDHVYDFKTWLQPHIAGIFKNHSQPHCYQIRKKDGICILQYRLYTGDKWEPSEGLKCLKVNIRFVCHKLTYLQKPIFINAS